MTDMIDSVLSPLVSAVGLTPGLTHTVPIFPIYMAADPENQKFGTMNSVFENVTIVEYRCPPLYGCWRGAKRPIRSQGISGSDYY